MPSLAPEEEARPRVTERVDDMRLRRTVIAHHALVWRTLRRMGVTDSGLDDGVSRVFDVLCRRLSDIEEGKEAAFLVAVATKIAADLRKAASRRARVEAEGGELVVGDARSPEQLLLADEARGLLQEALLGLDEDARAVFVLHELEQWTLAAIASALSVPEGTAKSRLRRARDQFDATAENIRQRMNDGGVP